MNFMEPKFVMKIHVQGKFHSNFKDPLSEKSSQARPKNGTYRFKQRSMQIITSPLRCLNIAHHLIAIYRMRKKASLKKQSGKSRLYLSPRNFHSNKV
jgi:hypothetical protein